MTCTHQSQPPGKDTGRRLCGLGWYGGKPWLGDCQACLTAQPGETRAPSPAAQIQSAAHAAHRFARSGFLATPPEILAQREATCRACDQWDAAALNATGRCRKCGCSTWAKLRMATESCPLGKWSALSSPSVPPVSSVVNPLPPAP